MEKWTEAQRRKAINDYLASKVKPTPSPTPKPRVAPMQSMTEAQRQEKALKDLMKKRQAEAKKTGIWPNYGTN
jgi:hypothetical protein